MAKKNFSYSSNTYEGGGYKGGSATIKKGQSYSRTSTNLATGKKTTTTGNLTPISGNEFKSNRVSGASTVASKINANLSQARKNGTLSTPRLAQKAVKRVTPNRSGRTTSTTTARPAQIKKKLY